MLNARGAPHIIYALVNGDIIAVDTTRPNESRTITESTERQVVDIASSPSGDRVAVLSVSANETAGAAEVVIFGQDGSEITRWSDIGKTGDAPVATPETASADASGTIDWSTSGSRLMVVLQNNTLVSIAIDGDAEEIAVPGKIRGIVDAAWSPRGDKIAVLAKDGQESGVVWVFNPSVDGDSTKQVVPPNADATNLGSVVAFSWLPDGSGLAFILANEVGPDVPGGQLYTVDLKTGIRLVVATPGRGGPAALIVDFEISPDGKSIAYTIAVPSADEWLFDSLWIRSLRTSNAYNVPVASTDRVVRVWWADPGIVWQQGTDAAAKVIVKAEDADPLTLIEVATGDQATPSVAAIPLATPEPATPIAATPEG